MRALACILMAACAAGAGTGMPPEGGVPAGPAAAVSAPNARGRLLAVMDILDNTGEFSAFANGLPDMLITELMQSGGLKLVERTKVQTAMKALKLETSGLTRESNQELGKWLGVDGILFGAFNRVGDRYRLDVRAIDVQTGEITAAASATCERGKVLEVVPEIGRQLRVRLGDPVSVPAAPRVPPPPAPDSCPLVIRYKMIVGLFAEGSVPSQRVRVYLDDSLIATSGVVDALNRYFEIFRGRIPAGSHTLALVHGSVDRSGRWLRALATQPDPSELTLRKDDRASVRYRMLIHDDSFAFRDFDIDYHTPDTGD